MSRCEQARQILAFRAHQEVNSSGFFSSRSGNSLMILFHQYRYLKKPEKKMSDGDGF